MDGLLPLAASASRAELVLTLSRIKNGLIGKRERKLEVLRGGHTQSLAHLIHPSEASVDGLNLSIQAAAIIGALSLPTPEAVTTLLTAGAHNALTTSLVSLSSSSSPSSSSSDALLPLRRKLLETLLRSLKALYLDLVKVVGPRAWGCDVIGASVQLEERQDVQQSHHWDFDPAGKGKQRDDTVDMEGVEGTGCVPDLKALAEEALRAIYAARVVPASAFASSSEAGPSVGPPRQEPTPVLAVLLHLLRDCSRAGGGTSPLVSDSNRFRLADMICTLVAGTVRVPYQRTAVLVDPEVTEALHHLVERGNGKVQEAALHALSALARDHRRMSILINTTGSERGRLVDLITELTVSPTASLRLAATTCQCILYKTLVDGKEPADSLVGMAEPLVPILLNLMEKEPIFRAQSSFIFAYLVADNEGLQDMAVKLKCLATLKEVLHAPPRVDQPYSTPASLEETSRVQEGALLSLAVLTATIEETRHRVLAAGLVPTVVAFLSSASPGVRAASCHVLRGLARSVHVLRTSLVESGAAKPIARLLRDEEDEVVKITAAAAISNLVLEFSPMRETLLEEGCIRRLCELARSENLMLRINALAAIRNATYQSQASFKRTTISALGWAYLAECISDPEEDVSVQALFILQNVACTVGDSPIDGLAEIGEDRLLSLLENKLLSKSTTLMIPVVKILINIATADEPAKLAIVARIKLLQTLVSLFDHPNAELRVGAVWVMINLSYQDRHPHERRRPAEIVARLRAMGVEHKLRGMGGDASLDVRERVRDCINTMAESGGPGISGY
ncbi:hypothetical protein RQP46_006229 [Phenoliferia psychrophenolica]